MDVIQFADPHYASKAVMKYGSKESLILDMGCGQGAVCDLLAKEGYQNLYGIDGSEAMLESAKKKGIYKEIHMLLLGI